MLYGTNPGLRNQRNLGNRVKTCKIDQVLRAPMLDVRQGCFYRCLNYSVRHPLCSSAT